MVLLWTLVCPIHIHTMSIKDLTDEQFDFWAAGFFDADGCIARRNSKTKGVNISITISQADPTILFELKRRYGGYIYHVKPNAKAHQVKTFYIYRIFVINDILSFLKRIGPYFVSKKKQYDVVLPYLETRAWLDMTIDEHKQFLDNLTAMKKENFNLSSLSEENFNEISSSAKNDLRAGGF